MKAKEVIQHRRETSMSSVPSSPRSINPIHGRHASTDSTDFKEIALLPRKPMPNYLRPTISSAHNAPPTKSLVRRRSTDKLTSPPLPHQPLRARGSNASEKTPKAAPSSKALVSGKSLKTNKSGMMMTPVSSKATRVPKKATPVEKVLCIDNGSGPARVKDEEDHSAQTSNTNYSPIIREHIFVC